MILNVIRYLFLKDRTIGKLFIDGSFFCYTLEDPVRASGVKIYGETAIAECVTILKITESPKFKRKLPLIVDVDGFDGVRMHRLNDPSETLGCIGVGFKYDSVSKKIYKSKECEEELVKKLGTGTHILIISNDIKGVTS